MSRLNQGKKTSGRKNTRQPIQYLILKTLATNKKLSMLNVIPEVEKILVQENYFKQERRIKSSYVITRTIKKLTTEGMILVRYEENIGYITLSTKGVQKFQNSIFLEQKAIISLTWDNVFRVVILNFTEEEKNDRERVRYALRRARFIPLSSGVYVTIFPLEHIIGNLITAYSPGKIIFMRSNELDQTTTQMILKEFRI